MVRFTADVLNGVPSIVIGIAVYALVVIRQRHFSALAGGVALGDHDDSHDRADDRRNVADGAARSCARPPWAGYSQVAHHLSITLRTASAGVITGCMLAFARVAGETAPLLFTAFGNQFWN